MSIIKNIFIIIVLTMIATACVTSQNFQPSTTNQSNYVSYISEDGFEINVPKSKPIIKPDTFEYGGIKGIGKSYNWKNETAYDYYVIFYDFNNRKDPLTESEKEIYLEGNRKSIVDLSKNNNFPVTEKKYIFNGNGGIEITADNIKGNSKILARLFYVNERFYFISFTFNKKTLEDSQIYQIADSFTIIDSESKTDLK